MNATVLDSRRRLVMPPELPARSAVIVQRVDDDTWLVRHAKPARYRVVVLMPDVNELPPDPEWEIIESKIVAHNNKKLTACVE